MIKVTYYHDYIGVPIKLEGDLLTISIAFNPIKLDVFHCVPCYIHLITQTTCYSRGQDVIPWDLLAEIDFFVLSYSLTLS